MTLSFSNGREEIRSDLQKNPYVNQNRITRWFEVANQPIAGPEKVITDVSIIVYKRSFFGTVSYKKHIADVINPRETIEWDLISEKEAWIAIDLTFHIDGVRKSETFAADTGSFCIYMAVSIVPEFGGYAAASYLYLPY